MHLIFLRRQLSQAVTSRARFRLFWPLDEPVLGSSKIKRNVWSIRGRAGIWGNGAEQVLGNRPVGDVPEEKAL